MTTGWTKQRRRQLAALDNLLREVSLIDNGSSCLRRITTCIRESKKLIKINYKKGSAISFINFLSEQAYADTSKDKQP